MFNYSVKDLQSQPTMHSEKISLLFPTGYTREKAGNLSWEFFFELKLLIMTLR